MNSRPTVSSCSRRERLACRREDASGESAWPRGRGAGLPTMAPRGTQVARGYGAQRWVCGIARGWLSHGLWGGALSNCEGDCLTDAVRMECGHAVRAWNNWYHCMGRAIEDRAGDVAGASVESGRVHSCACGGGSGGVVGGGLARFGVKVPGTANAGRWVERLCVRVWNRKVERASGPFMALHRPEARANQQSNLFEAP